MRPVCVRGGCVRAGEEEEGKPRALMWLVQPGSLLTANESGRRYVGVGSPGVGVVICGVVSIAIMASRIDWWREWCPGGHRLFARVRVWRAPSRIELAWRCAVERETCWQLVWVW